MISSPNFPARPDAAGGASAPAATGGECVACVTLGCPKNQVDSEAMLGQLHRAGYTATADLAAADVVIINTCCFIEPAREESIDVILEVVARKGEGRLQAVVVAGCLAQRYGAELFDELPEIDAVVGTGALGEIGRVVRELLGGARRTLRVGRPGAPIGDLGTRVLSTPPHYAYLKISEGCDHRCAFCIIPALRGPMQSRPVAELVAEAERLVAAGVRELNLIAQDTTAYGSDLPGGRRALIELLAGLDRIAGLEWIRLLYTHPALWTDALMDTVAGLERVVPYVDVPIQHISEPLLQTMQRGISGARVRAVLDRLRRRVPGIALRTSILVGHPGETAADQEELLEFLAAFRFERLGVFAYSREEGTPAGEAASQVEMAVVTERHEQVVKLARSIAVARQSERVGSTIPVMVDGPAEEGRTPARSTWDAPEIDGCVWLHAVDLTPGQIIPARIIGCGPHDLVAEPVPAGEAPAPRVSAPVDAPGPRAVRSSADGSSPPPEVAE